MWPLVLHAAGSLRGQKANSGVLADATRGMGLGEEPQPPPPLQQTDERIHGVLQLHVFAGHSKRQAAASLIITHSSAWALACVKRIKRS